MGRDDFVEQLLSATDFKSAIGKYMPDALIELEATAEGAEQDAGLLFAWQLIDEWIGYAVEHYMPAHCSSFGAYDQGADLPNIIGKTQDLLPLYLDHVTLTRIKTRTGEVFDAGVAGVLFQDGLNDKGVGVCCNVVAQLRGDSKGLPTAFILRHVLRNATSAEEAARMFSDLPCATGMNYVCGDKNGVIDIEASSDQGVRHTPAPELKRVWHTNHPISSTDFGDKIELWNGLPDSELGNTHARLASLENTVCGHDGPFDLTAAKAALSSRDGPVSALPEDGFPTVNGLIIEFYEEPVLHFCEGAPSQGEWEEFRFD